MNSTLGNTLARKSEKPVKIGKVERGYLVNKTVERRQWREDMGGRQTPHRRGLLELVLPDAKGEPDVVADASPHCIEGLLIG